MEKERMREHHEWSEQAESIGYQLMERVKELVGEVNKRRLKISRASGKALFEVPLLVSLIVVGVAAIFGPRLVALAAIAALVAGVKVEVRGQAKGSIDETDDLDY